MLHSWEVKDKLNFVQTHSGPWLVVEFSRKLPQKAFISGWWRRHLGSDLCTRGAARPSCTGPFTAVSPWLPFALVLLARSLKIVSVLRDRIKVLPQTKGQNGGMSCGSWGLLRVSKSDCPMENKRLKSGPAPLETSIYSVVLEKQYGWRVRLLNSFIHPSSFSKHMLKACYGLGTGLSSGHERSSKEWPLFSRRVSQSWMTVSIDQKLWENLGET